VATIYTTDDLRKLINSCPNLGLVPDDPDTSAVSLSPDHGGVDTTSNCSRQFSQGANWY